MDNYREYKFRIDAYSPETIPMARLAEYMADLANLLGYKHSVHFSRLEDGSTTLVHRVDSEDVPKVEDRIKTVKRGEGPPDVLKAFRSLDSKLAKDNAVGSLLDVGGAKIITFPGRDRPKPLEYGAFRQRAPLQGILVRIGGKDETAHALIQDGDVYYANCVLKRDLARRLAPHLFGRPVRLHGTGRWNRDPDGEWELLQFSVESFDVLDDEPLSDVVGKLRSMLPEQEPSGMLDFLNNVRKDEDDD